MLAQNLVTFECKIGAEYLAAKQDCEINDSTFTSNGNDTGCICLFSIRSAILAFSLLGEVYHLASYTGNNGAGHIVILSQVRECYSGGASIE